MGLLHEGQSINNTYTVERFLGEGAFAEVYRVRHRFLGRQAMKVFKQNSMSLDDVEKQLGEAVLLSQIGHPNIIRVFDANIYQSRDQNIGYFTMEYVAGGNLGQYWKSFGRGFIPVDTTVQIMSQIARGLTIAHSNNPPIIHRDIKPQNILIGYDGTGLRTRISDFGLAKKVNPLTLLASSRGTICFKAPETFSEPESDSCAGDVWALGCTLYLLLTDILPFAEDNHPSFTTYMDFATPVTKPSVYNLNVDPILEAIVLKALSINRADRYPSAVQFLDALEKWKPSTNKTLPDTSDSSLNKSAFGMTSPLDEIKAMKMVKQAIELSKSPNSLNDAADLMEQALNEFPSLRKEHENKVTYWRRGILC